jgi:hypothetical protein
VDAAGELLTLVDPNVTAASAELRAMCKWSPVANPVSPLAEHLPVLDRIADLHVD